MFSGVVYRRSQIFGFHYLHTKITNLNYTLTLFSRDNSIVHGFSLDIEKDIMLRNIVLGFKRRLLIMTNLTASPSTWTGIVFVVTILAVLHWTMQ
jgi:hypothetical protein